MAGRPLGMINKVAKLEALSVELCAAVFKTIPSQYLRDVEELDQLAPLHTLQDVWQASYTHYIQAMVDLEFLGRRLRSKAGVELPSPSQKTMDELLSAQAKRTAKLFPSGIVGDVADECVVQGGEG